MKKIFLMFLVITMFFSITAKALTDDEFEIAKNLLEELDIITNLDYDAEGITRAEMTQIIFRMKNSPLRVGIIQRPFIDVNEDYWADQYIETLAYSLIIRGDGDGCFRPDDFITYAEMVMMIVRMLGWSPALIHFGGYLGVFQELEINIDVEDIHEKVSINVAIPIIYQALHANTLEFVGNESVHIENNVHSHNRAYETRPSLLERRNLE